jgi:hypothetical protein
MANKKADKSDDGCLYQMSYVLFWVECGYLNCRPKPATSVTKSNLCECGEELWFSISIKVIIDIIITILLLGVSRNLSCPSMSEVSFFVQGRGQEGQRDHDSRRKET